MTGFIGLSHLGIIYSLASAYKSQMTVAYDPDETLVASLEQGVFPIEEPGLSEVFLANRSRIRYSARASDLNKCSIIFLSQDVFTDSDNRADLSRVQKLLDNALAEIPRAIPLVILSQVPPGFSRAFQSSEMGKSRPVLYQVETLVFGRALERALHPERFVIGVPDSKTSLPEAYRTWQASFECPLIIMRYESAELAKIAINLFLVSSISTTNMLANLCEKIGADWSEIVPSLRLDARIGQSAYLTPGLGVAGGNLERDLVAFQALANQAGADWRLIPAWQQLNRQRSGWVFAKLTDQLDLNQNIRSVAVWGVAYKENTHSTKNSASLALLSKLPHLEKRVYDPKVRLSPDAFPKLVVCDDWQMSCATVDAIVIMTPWPEFRNISIPELAKLFDGKLVIDPYGLLDSGQVRAQGWEYFKMGTNLVGEHLFE